MTPETIETAFHCTRFNACLALLIIRGRVNPADHPRRFPKLADWIRQCYHEPRRSEQSLAALDELLGTYGVEPISVEGAWIDRYHGNIVASYLNTGDTYSPTLLLDHGRGRWKLTSWGEWFEAYEIANPPLQED